MSQIRFSLCVFLLLLMFSSDVCGQDKIKIRQDSLYSPSQKYIIISTGQQPTLKYRPFIRIFYGSDIIDEVQLSQEQAKKPLESYVIDLLIKFSKEGYDLVTATTRATTNEYVLEKERCRGKD